MQTVVGTFEIPEDVARKLSELMTKHDIYESLMIKAVNDPAAFDVIEQKLISVTEKYDELRTTITDKMLPDKYRKPEYTWSYRGWGVDGRTITVWE